MVHRFRSKVVKSVARVTTVCLGNKPLKCQKDKARNCSETCPLFIQTGPDTAVLCCGECQVKVGDPDVRQSDD
jgi:hypothetical protein